MNHNIERDAQRLYNLLLEGGVALVPTQTGYGLIAMKTPAVRRIYALKGRPGEKPCVTVGSLPVLDEVAVGVDPATRSWLASAIQSWPMALITRLNPASRLVASFEPFVLQQCTKADTIATFYGVGELVARVARLAYEHGQLIVGSSANLAGTGNNYAIEDVPDSIRGAVDLEIDYGRAALANPSKLASTILDLTKSTFQRQGVHFADIERSWKVFASSRASGIHA